MADSNENVSKEELFDEIMTMLMAALKIAGVSDEQMDKALDAYQEALERENNDDEYDYNKVAEIILGLKSTHKELFG